MTAPATFHLHPRGPYSFAQSARFLTHWGLPANSLATANGHIHIAFVPQGEDAVAGVCLREVDGAVMGEVFGDVTVETVHHEIERILSLDIDSTDYAEVGRRDHVVGHLQEQYTGLRPVLFFSPLEAAAWALMSQRVQLRQAVKVKANMARELGQSIEVHGDLLFAFPGPLALMQLTSYPGLFGRKAEYLQGIGYAAHAGMLDSTRLRALPPDEALTELKTIPGIGDFSAHLLLLRGVGRQDGPPTRERRFLRALALAYDLPGEPSEDEIVRISDGWRPYRTWVSVTLRAMLEDHERDNPS